MLAEERFDEILKYVNQEGSITVQKLIEYTNASESMEVRWHWNITQH